MTWTTMAPADVCDMMDYWARQSWPMLRSEVHRPAVEQFGWTTEVEGGVEYLMNTASRLTIPDVLKIHSREQLHSLQLYVTDVVRDITEEGTAFLGDAFTALVRDGQSRWGRPHQSTGHGRGYARWDHAGGSRIEFSLSDRAVKADFDTPQRVERERALGQR